MDLVSRVYAQLNAPSVNGNTLNTGGISLATNSNGSIQGLVTQVITWLIYIASVLAFGYLVYSGILYITAAGNPDAAKKGQQGIINAVIGIVIIVLAYVILRAISNAANTAATSFLTGRIFG